MNLITEACARGFGLNRQRATQQLLCADGTTGLKVKGIALTTICSRFNEDPIKQVYLNIVSELPQIMPSQPLMSIEDESQYADVNWNKPGPIEMLIGVGVWADITGDKKVRLSNGLVKQDTRLGCVLFGESQSALMTEALCGIIKEEESLIDVIGKLWELDNVREPKSMSANDEWCEENFRKTHTRSADGRYIVTIPLNPDDQQLGESRKTALRRFYMLENRLKKNPELAAKYIEFMREYESQGHMRPVDIKLDPGGPLCFLPHHAVLSKFRVVFDASAVTSNGKSLNSIQLAGPKLQPDLLKTIINFRAGRVAFSADIKKMFRQVQVHRDQWNLQRIFWRESPHDPLVEYWLTVVTYGMTASSYNAVRALIQCAEDYANVYPRAAEIVKNNFYMDDMLACADTEEDALVEKKDVTAMLKEGGFELAKWVSNSPRMMDDSLDVERKSLQMEESPSILGLKWDHVSDHLMIKVNLRPQPKNMTKRQLASECARIFDPLKLLSPATVLAKQFLKALWELRIGWDERIPEDLQKKWEEYYKDLESLAQLRIPRWIGITADARTQLHIFADASNVAYGAAAYLAVQGNEGIRCNLIMATSKLSPKSMTSIPRLELAAAVLGVQLYNQVKETIVCREADAFFWTDSEIVLYWLRKSSDLLKVFVGNRVAKIQRATLIEKWGHVRSHQNPADLLSRGLSVTEMINSSLWWNGPAFLSDKQYVWSAWKETGDNKYDKEITAEMRSIPATALCGAITYREPSGDEDELISRYSSIRKLLNVTARVLRIVRCFLRKIKRRKSECNPLLAIEIPDAFGEFVNEEERDIALKIWIQHHQKSSFAAEYEALSKGESLKKDSRLKAITPFLDQGVMRVWGRLDNMEACYDTKHPMILDAKSRLARLLISDAHIKMSHGTTDMVRVYLRMKFHMIGARVAIRNHSQKCVPCVRQIGRIPTQFMADLPKVRVSPAKAFYSTGIDYAGPFILKRGRGRPVGKAYIAIFVCMVYKAIHLEIVHDVSALTFLAALDRFIAMRAGQVRHIYCDNARNFVGARGELIKARESWESTEVAAFSSANEIKWHFNTPQNPHAGGLWERAVRSVKTHLNRMGGATAYTAEGLSTLLARVTMCLNSRPLSSMSDDPRDMSVLTAGHFIVGGPMVQPWAPDYTQIPDSRLKAWQRIHQIQQSFWKRWSQECILEQQRRNKWVLPKRNMRVGDLVLLRSPSPPTLWLMGRVERVYPDEKGYVRSVEVRTEFSTFKRPIGELCILPVDSELREGAPRLDSHEFGARESNQQS